MSFESVINNFPMQLFFMDLKSINALNLYLANGYEIFLSVCLCFEEINVWYFNNIHNTEIVCISRVILSTLL